MKFPMVDVETVVYVYVLKCGALWLLVTSSVGSRWLAVPARGSLDLGA